MSIDLALYLITDAHSAEQAGHDIVDVIRATSDHITAIQIRHKQATSRELLNLTERIAAITPPHVSIILNDRIDVFLAARHQGIPVSGVHLGHTDIPPHIARELIGPEAVLGLSISTAAHLHHTTQVNYVGIGPLHATATKTNAPPPLGHDAVRHLIATTQLPAVIIGGVTHHDIPHLKKAGAAGIAVASAICSAPKPDLAAHTLATHWHQ